MSPKDSSSINHLHVYTHRSFSITMDHTLKLTQCQSKCKRDITDWPCCHLSTFCCCDLANNAPAGKLKNYACNCDSVTGNAAHYNFSLSAQTQFLPAVTTIHLCTLHTLQHVLALQCLDEFSPICTAHIVASNQQTISIISVLGSFLFLLFTCRIIKSEHET